MAGKGISIQFLSDVAGFLRGTKDVESALDKVGDSLDDLTKEASKAGEGFGDGLKDGAKEAERAVDDLGDSVKRSLDDVDDQARDAGRALGNELEDGADKAEDATRSLERKFRDVFDTVQDTSRKAGDDLGSNVEKGARRAGDGLDNMKDEANETAREVAASFDGSLDDVADGFQEVAATAFAGFGPAGAIAGLAVAAAAGTWYAAWRENAEKAEERIRSMYEDMLASGQNFLSAQYVNEGISKIITGADDAAISMDRAREISEKTGLTLQTVLRAWAGDADAAALAQGVLNGQVGDAVDANDAGVWALREYQDSLRGVTEATGTAAEQSDLYRSTVQTSAEAVRDYAAAQAEQGELTRDAMSAIQENNTALAGQADQLRTQNLGALADYAAGLVGVQEKGAAAGISTADLTALQITQAAQFVATAQAAGITEQAALDLAVQYGLIPADVATQIRAEGGVDAISTAQQVKAAVDAIPNTKTITIRTVLSDGALSGGATGSMLMRASGGYVGGFPDGGMVGGPGGPIDDRVLARLSRGEYVLDAQTVQQIGTGRLDQINNGQRGPRPPAPTAPTAEEIGRAVGNAVAVALEGASLNITGVNMIYDTLVTRLYLEARRGAARH